MFALFLVAEANSFCIFLAVLSHVRYTKVFSHRQKSPAVAGWIPGWPPFPLFTKIGLDLWFLETPCSRTFSSSEIFTAENQAMSSVFPHTICTPPDPIISVSDSPNVRTKGVGLRFFFQFRWDGDSRWTGVADRNKREKKNTDFIPETRLFFCGKLSFERFHHQKFITLHNCYVFQNERSFWAADQKRTIVSAKDSNFEQN